MTSAATLRTIASASDYLARIAKVRSAMVAQQVDATLLSVGHDLPYLSGYLAILRGQTINNSVHHQKIPNAITSTV